MGPKLVVLAAGLGSRFGSSKQVEAVGPRGEAILEYSIYDALAAGFDEILFVIRRDMEAGFREMVASRLPARVSFRFAFQELDSVLEEPLRSAALASNRVKPWGTGHAALCGAAGLDAPFAVINADDFYGRGTFRTAGEFLSAVDPRAASWCMAGFRLANTTSPHGPVARGLCEFDAEGMLLSVVEHARVEEVRAAGGSPGAGRGSVAAASGIAYRSLLEDGTTLPLSGAEVVSMNFWGFTPPFFELALPRFRDFAARELGRSDTADPGAAAKTEFYLPELVGALAAAGEASVRVIPTPETWFGLTYRADLAAVRERIAALTAAGLYPSPLWAGG